MKINLYRPGLPSENALLQGVLPVIGAGILVAGLLILPAPALFLAALIGATGLGLSLAGLRRHGGPDVPALPQTPER